MPFTPEQKQNYDKKKKLEDVWKELEEDNTLTEKEAEIASYMKSNYVDITDRNDIWQFMIKDNISGKYKPVKIPPFTDMNTQHAVMYIRQLYSELQANGEIYDFHELTEGNKVHVISRSNSGGISHNTNYYDNIQEPARVSKPGLFKTLTNKWFGWFKKDIEKYSEYEIKKAFYDAKIKDKTEVEEASEPFRETIEQEKTKKKDFLAVRRELEDNKPIQEKLKELAEAEKREYKVIEVVSGRSKEYIGHHENYHRIVEIPLKSSDKLNVEGLALLAACSVDVNKSVRDGSSQPDLVLNGDHQPSPQEKELLNKLDHANQVSNVGGKILESVYGGGDIQRMGDRMAAVVASREVLNNAIEQYNANNRQPLADLINDSIAAIYDFAVSLGERSNKPSAKAVTEITETLTGLFNRDPELRAMVDFPEDKFNELKGAAKAYKELEHMKEKQYQACLSDEGPNTPKREELLGELMFGGVLHAIIDKQVLDANYANIRKNEIEAEAEEYTNLMANYPDKSDNANIMFAVATFLNQKNSRLPEILITMSKPEFNMENFKKSMISQIKETDTFKTLVGLSKEELFDRDLKKMGVLIFKETSVINKKKLEDIQAGNEINRQAGQKEAEIIAEAPKVEEVVAGVSGLN